MPDSFKDIIITPNRNTANVSPNISFRGGNTSSNTSIVLNVYADNNGTLSFEGNSGQLFSITDDLTGTIFSVNDISGIPSIEVNADGTVKIAEYSGNVGVGVSVPNAKLHVDGNIIFNRGLYVQGVATGNNYIIINNANTGNAVVLTTGGTENNVTLALMTKGTGNIVLDTGTGLGNIDLKPGSGWFKLWDDNSTHFYRFVTGDRSANYDINFPAGSVTLTAGTTVVTDATDQTIAGNKRFSSNLALTGSGTQLLLKNSTVNDPTVIHRADGTHYYILLSNAATTANTGWNSLRPFYINQTTGTLYSLNGQEFQGNTFINGELSITDKIVHSGDTNTALRFPADDTFTIETGGAEEFRIDPSGNVGIGTTNPLALLDVAGRANISGILIAAGNVYPIVDNSGEIGNSALTWNNGTFTNMTIDSTLNIRAALDLADADVARFGSNDDAYFVYDGTANIFELQLETTSNAFIITENGTHRFTFNRTGNLNVHSGTINSLGTKAIFTPFSAEFPTANAAALTVVNSRPALAFDTTVAESVFWTTLVPQGMNGNLQLVVSYKMASATSGNVVFSSNIEAITSGDSTDLDSTTSFATINMGPIQAVPGTAGFMKQFNINLPNNDSYEQGDYLRIDLTRQTANVFDTAAGDCYVLNAEIRKVS